MLMERLLQILHYVLEDNIKGFVAVPLTNDNEKFILELENKGIVTKLEYKMSSLVVKFNHQKLKEFLKIYDNQN